MGSLEQEVPAEVGRARLWLSVEGGAESQGSQDEASSGIEVCGLKDGAIWLPSILHVDGY